MRIAATCADPAKVDVLRVNAKRLYAGFPLSIPEMARLGYKDAETILTTKITEFEHVRRWVHSIFNSSVPLSAARHIARHKYPKPITDIELIK